MTLESLLSLDRIIPDLKATEHWPAIEELVGHLSEKGLLEDAARNSVLDALREREDKTSTGIGYGVAIPHAFADDIDEVITIFGRSLAGVEFASIDNTPVNFIILFIVPKDQYHLHLKTLAAIAKLLNNADIRRQLLEAKDAQELLTILSKRPARV